MQQEGFDDGPYEAFDEGGRDNDVVVEDAADYDGEFITPSYEAEESEGSEDVTFESSELPSDVHAAESLNKAEVEAKTSPKSFGKELLQYYAFPFTIWIVLFNEFCERFSYYVQRAILTLYLENGLQMSDDVAVSLYSALLAFIYTFPLVGAIVSDSFLGPYNTIASFSIVYVIGAAMLAATTNPPKLWGALTGLGLISIGAGGIKPCVAMFGAEQINHKLKENTEEEKITKARITSNYFSVFYLSINVSSTFSYIFAPIIRTKIGYGAAFALPAICLAVSTAIFIFSRTCFYIPQVKKKEIIILTPAKVVFVTVKHFFATKFGFTKIQDNNHVQLFDESEGSPSINNNETTEKSLGYFQPAVARFGQKAVSDTISLLEIALVYVFIAMFYALIDQQGSSWTIQAEKMDLNVFGYNLEPEQPQTINPFMLTLFIPLLNVLVFPLLRRWGIELSTMNRLFIGLVICLIGFIPCVFVEIAINNSTEKVSILWQIPQLALTTFGESFVGPAGYCLAWTWAPPEYKSFAASLLLMSIALGDAIISLIYLIFGGIFSQVVIYWIFIGLAIANHTFFFFLTRKFAAKEAELLKNPMGEAKTEETEMKEIS